MGMPIPLTDAITGNSIHGVSVASNGALTLPANTQRNGLNIQVDPATAATTPQLYILLSATGTPSPTNFDICVTPTLPWPGVISGTVWRGPINGKWVGSAGVGIAVVEV